MIPGISTGGGGLSNQSSATSGGTASFGGISFGAIPPMPGYQSAAINSGGISWGVVLGGAAVLGVVYLAVRG